MQVTAPSFKDVNEISVSRPSDKDHLLAYVADKLKAPEQLPQSYTWPEVARIRFRGGDPDISSMAYAFAFAREAAARRFQGLFYDLSPRFLQELRPHKAQQSSISARDATVVLRTYGLCPESYFPALKEPVQRDQDRPTDPKLIIDAIIRFGRPMRVAGAFKVESPLQVQQALLDVSPVVIVMKTADIPGLDVVSSKAALRTEDLGYHALCIYAYSAGPGGADPVFTARNCWSRDAPDVTIPLARYQSIVIEAWCLVCVLPANELAPPNPPANMSAACGMITLAGSENIGFDDSFCESIYNESEEKRKEDLFGFLTWSAIFIVVLIVIAFAIYYFSKTLFATPSTLPGAPASSSSL